MGRGSRVWGTQHGAAEAPGLCWLYSASTCKGGEGGRSLPCQGSSGRAHHHPRPQIQRNTVGTPVCAPRVPPVPCPLPPQPASSQPWRWGSRTPPPRPTSPPPQDPPLSQGPPHTPRGPRCVSPCYPQGDPNVWDSHPASPGDTRHPPTLQRDPPDPPFSPGPRCPPPLFPQWHPNIWNPHPPPLPRHPQTHPPLPQGSQPPCHPQGTPRGGWCVCVRAPPPPPTLVYWVSALQM